MAVYFSHPYVLLAWPPVVAVLILLARGSYAGLSRARWWLALGVRLVVVSLLALAAADLHVGRKDKRLSVAFVVDTSRSIQPEQQAQAETFLRKAAAVKPEDANVAVLTAAGEATLTTPWTKALRRVAVSPAPRDGFTNLANALRLAVAAMPSGGARRLVLLSDGNENEGDVRAEALAVREAGMTLDTVLLPGRRTGEVFVESLTTSSPVKRGEAVEVRLTVDSQVAVPAELHLVSEGREIASRQASLHKGKNAFSLTTSFDAPGFHEVKALVVPRTDGVAENNQASGFVLVKGRAKVLYAEGDLDEAGLLAKALRTQGVDVEVCGAESLPSSLRDLEAYDAVILSDVPAPDLSESQMEMLKSAVRDAGIGLVMIGGRNSFAVGGYFDTPVEDALPVKMEVKHKRIAQRTAIVIVIDKSGSMGVIENGAPKFALANEAACATTRLLGRLDSIGVIATDSVPRAVVPLQRAVHKDALCDQIATIRPGGGGIYCRVSLEAAGRMLLGTRAGARHLILLADGADSEQQEGCLGLAQELVQNGITISCVAIGDGQDVPFLQQLAAVGKGRFYLTNLAANLPRIFTKETALAMRSQLVEEPFTPVLSAPSDILRGLPALPPLLGYVATTPKPLAAVSLVSHHRDPVLAAWQYGLGRAVAFTSSCKSGWGVHWVKWSGYSKFWSQLVRWVMRRSRPAGFDARVVWEGDKGKIIVDAVDEQGRFRNFQRFRAAVAAPDGDGESVKLVQTAPGRYEGAFTRKGIGSYVITVRGGRDGRETLVFGVSVPYAPDLRDLESNAALLREAAALGGGQVLTDPEDAFRPGRAQTVSAASLAPLLLALAMTLFVLDVAVRRLIIEPAAVVAAVVGVWVSWRNRRRAGAPREETMTRLLRRKTAATETVRPAPTATPSVSPSLSDASSPSASSPTGALSPAAPQPPPQEPCPPEQPSPPETHEESSDTLSRLKRAKHRVGSGRPRPDESD